LPALGFALLAGCEYLGRTLYGYDLVLPRPSTLLGFAIDQGRYLAVATLYTLLKVLGGLIIGCASATTLSFGSVLLPLLRSPLSRFALWSQTLPIPLLAPLLGLVLGYNIWSGVTIAALICFFPVYLGWEQGQLALPTDVALLAQSYRPSRLRYVRHILLPASLPHALIGLKGAINLAILGATIAEFTGSGEGLGRLMMIGIRQLEPAKSWGAMALLACVAVLMTSSVTRIQKMRRFLYAGGSYELGLGSKA
jgi:ABC-type nitrate/sulfonate/bicarbonate transport system permease component